MADSISARGCFPCSTSDRGPLPSCTQYECPIVGRQTPTPFRAEPPPLRLSLNAQVSPSRRPHLFPLRNSNPARPPLVQT
eukprot:365283-Chlamydomonas_euryale.AAC.7